MHDEDTAVLVEDDTAGGADLRLAGGHWACQPAGAGAGSVTGPRE